LTRLYDLKLNLNENILREILKNASNFQVKTLFFMFVNDNNFDTYIQICIDKPKNIN